MDDVRFVDALRSLAADVLREAGAPDDAAVDLADEIVRRTCDQWGGEKYWIHRKLEDHTEKLAVDNRPASVVAKELGVAKSTIYRRRRQLSSGIK